MEGMPRVPMLLPEPKIPANQYDDEFRLKIKEYILLHFQDDPSKYDNAITELINLKQKISTTYADVETACLLKRYYAQLLMMKNRFPMEEGDPIKVLFCWYDRAMDIAHSATYDDIGFELACVMYNIGAVHASIAVNEGRENEDSIKNAFMHYQYAAWPLQHLRDKMNASKYASVDFDKELLTFFVNVLLGQAQECLLEKSLIDHRSNLVVAKLAIHLRDRYQECYQHLENSNLCDYVSSQKYKLWARTCAIKSEMYGCIALIHLGCQADDDKRMGARYGYYKIANDHLNAVIKAAEKEDRDTMKASIGFLSDVVGTKLTNAKKENEFIYHERIPANDELCKDLEGLCKVRPLSFDPLDVSVGGEDLFGGLLPPGVIKAVSEYEEEKAKLKREVIERTDKRDEELNSFLVSLRIDEIDLDADSTGPILPDMLLERNAALTTQPDAIPKLLETLTKVGDLAREAGAKLSGLTGRLADVDLPEITSDEGYKAIKKELERLTEHHQKARSNNVELHKALAAHSTNLHLLSLPIAELTSKLAGPAINAGSTKEGAALRRVLDKTREMQTQRAQLLQRFTEEMNNDNIAKKLLSERDTDHKDLFSTELKKHDETLKYLDANLNAQEKILSALTEANADFSDYRKKIKASLNTRSEHIMTLVTAYDVYCDVCQKVEDGRNFYLKLLDRLNKLTLAVEGIETAFGAERQKREAEKRALEEKMAALKRANEAREALADFSIGGMPGSRPQAQAGVPGARPRFGDYKEFYLNKMAAASGAPPGYIPPPQPMAYQPPQPSPTPAAVFPGATHHQHVLPADHYAGGPPSPAPSSIPDSTAYYHHHEEPKHMSPAPQHLQYSQMPPMPAMSYAAQAAAQNPALSVPQHLQPSAYSVQNGAHQAPQMMAQSHFTPTKPLQPPTHHTHTSLSSQQQAQVPGAMYVPQQYQPHHDLQSLPTPAVATPISSVNASAAAAQWNQVQQPGAPQMPPPNMQNLPMQPAQQQVMFSSTSLPQPPAGIQQPYTSIPTQQPLQSFPVAPQQPVSTSMQQPAPHGFTPQQPTTAVIPGVPPGAGMNMQTQPGAMPSGSALAHPAPQHISQPYGQTQALCGALPVQGNQVLTMPNLNQNGTVVQQNVSGAEKPASVGVPPTQGAPATPAGQQTNQQGASVLPQVPQVVQPPVQFTPLIPAGASPWHVGAPSNVAPSPWHSVPPVVGVIPNSTPTPPLQQCQPTQVVQNTGQTYQTAQKPVSNVDLLDGIIDNTNLPPAMIPQPKSMENQNLLRSCAPSSSVSAESITLSAIHRLPDIAVSQTAQQPNQNPTAATVAPVQPAQWQETSSSQPAQASAQLPRPAAAVMPIQHQNVTAPVGRPVAPPATTASSVPQAPRVLPLSDILDPTKFELGPGDKARLEKRQLHEHIRSGGDVPLPQLDPNDPLNSFDPFWKAR
ncbi:hypothetical protein V3C99_005780 [Haemonchus contortus]